VQAGPHRLQVEFAELLVDRFPGLERVRFTNSGSEAALLALRIARRATGRGRVLLFEGAYHGMGAEFTDGGPNVERMPFNSLDRLHILLDDTIAAVFVEAFLGHAGAIPAEPGFIEAVADLARLRGTVFVLDEVQSMRNDYRALHGSLGISPDLILMGKTLGGGLPIGLVGGRADLVEVASAATEGGLRHSGTFNGNVLSCAGGLACLNALGPNQIERLNERAAWLATRLEETGRSLDVPAVVTRSGSTMCLHFREARPRNAEEAESTEMGAWLHVAAMLEGVSIIPGGRMNLSTVLTDDDLDVATQALSRAMERVAGVAR
jgi:glutamate-1-semialdehyde 2,1-aminomutase